MSKITCTNCAAEWDADDDTYRHHFRVPDDDGTLIFSPASLAQHELIMAFCPKCPLPQDLSMGAPAPPDGLQEGRAPDSGERPPPEDS